MEAAKAIKIILRHTGCVTRSVKEVSACSMHPRLFTTIFMQSFDVRELFIDIAIIIHLCLSRMPSFSILIACSTLY